VSDFPRKASAEHRYLAHAQLLQLAHALDDDGALDTLTLVSGTAGA
jgi:hypothetical protein